MITVKKTVEKKEIECDFCHTVLEYEPSDVHDIYEGVGFTCPECGNGVVVDEEKYDRPLYPAAFFKFGNGYKATDYDIQEWCNKVFDALKNSEDPYVSYSVGSGDTIVFGNRYEDGEIVVRVAKNYEEYTCYSEDN